MSIAGFMKQINKANQMISEKIGGAKGTELDNQFHEMEKKTDVINKLVEDIRDRTNEYLQPNPASRVKLWTVNNFSKIKGQTKNTPYPQPEGTLGETMSRYGGELGSDSNFGYALLEMGECLRQMAGIKYALEDNVKQNFLDPLAQLKETELKDVMHLRRKMENRRLDYDCKKRKQKPVSAIGDDETRIAAEKFEESKRQAEDAMAHLLDNEVEHVTHLVGFAEGLLEYHNQCANILKGIVKTLNEKKKSLPSSSSTYKQSTLHNTSLAGSTQRKSSDAIQSRFYEDTTSSHSSSAYGDNMRHNGNGKYPTPPPISTMPSIGPNSVIGFKIPFETPTSSTSSSSSIKMPPPPVHQRNNNIMQNQNSRKEPSCRAIYDFDAENYEELEFREGDIIRLITRLDENWYEGEINGKRGRFPTSYVEILVPLN